MIAPFDWRVISILLVMYYVGYFVGYRRGKIVGREPK
ncbi:hypothetical protein SEA_LEOPARD_60 [Mycobacterium phage Leopard]|uniref:Uncharacterized protein n=1 Tax=Mycobacterium phage Onyinye TaxID=2686235 RepID=A0A6B9L756_9CAUD|nr:hypothetical protein PP339_gp061 [Mycobacterium phage Onyinye]QHB37466.1 hypothetical protein SEA_ONYINYE_61 [Mycobacterium phage Onyinye]UOW92937.1 hypothetical protein SEA_LEOPARD_60 [Mycobacterium phage Leopard]WKW85223.1 hypothetical protein SEA_AIKOY__61 [Mycobacterium phage Aikoy]